VLTVQLWAWRRRRPKFITYCPRLSDFTDFISVKRGRPSTVINSCSWQCIPLSQLVASDRLGDAYYTFCQCWGVAITLTCGSANLQINVTQRRWQLHQHRIFRRNRPLPNVVLLHSNRATPSDGGVFLQRDHAMESTLRLPAVDCFSMILTAAQNFLATIWPLIEFLRSLVVYVNHHNKDYLRITPCDWHWSDNAAFVKLLWPVVTFH